MSKNYNQTLQTNNSSLEEIITHLNNMPDAGGSAAPVLQDKTVTPTTSKQTVTADSGYDGLDTVTVNAMPTATQATPAISVNSSGLITASATQTAGYVSAGAKSATQQLSTQAAKTITPSTSSQTAVASGKYTTGAVTVAAIPSSYIQPSGTKTITTNGTHDVKNYASATVNVASTGEDVTAETNAYTEKIASLESAVSALETELANKTSCNEAESNQFVFVNTLPTTYAVDPDSPDIACYYLELPTDCIAVLFGVGSFDLAGGDPEEATSVLFASFRMSGIQFQNVTLGSHTVTWFKESDDPYLEIKTPTDSPLCYMLVCMSSKGGN